MPLNEIPKHIGPQTRSLIEAALEDAWQELSKDGNLEAAPARNKLRTTMVALASVGETDHRKLKWLPFMPGKGHTTGVSLDLSHGAARAIGMRATQSVAADRC